MIAFMNMMWMAVLVLATPALPASARVATTFVAEGVAEIKGNALDLARASALEDAKKRAVEQAIGLHVGQRTYIENYQLIGDKILSQAARYITQSSVIGENADSGLLRVRISAEVALERLTADLGGIGIPADRMLKGSGAKPVTITISGLNRAQFEKFKGDLMERVRGIEILGEGNFTDTKARISVNAMGGVRALSRELLQTDFGAFAVEVIGSTAHSLQLKVTQKLQ